MTQSYDTTPAASGEDRLQAALELAQKGLPVLPLCWPTPQGTCGCGRGHENNSIGKAPLTQRGVLDATTDEETVRLWWSVWPEANIGLALAPAGLVSIAPDSAEWHAEFERRGLPEGAAVFESGGGEGHVHYLFHRPAGCPTRRLCRAGEFDILADGYVVVPPSRHRAGRPYRWLRPLVEVGFLPDAPAWAVEMLQAASRPGVVDGEEDDDGPPVRLSEEAMKWWMGEKCCRRPDGHIDRSATLFIIGLVLADAGATARTIARCLAERDVALGFHKYTDRPDGGREEYLRIARKALLFSQASRQGEVAASGNSPRVTGNGRKFGSCDALYMH